MPSETVSEPVRRKIAAGKTVAPGEIVCPGRIVSETATGAGMVGQPVGSARLDPGGMAEMCPADMSPAQVSSAHSAEMAPAKSSQVSAA